jgi:hypothetical protein
MILCGSCLQQGVTDCQFETPNKTKQKFSNKPKKAPCYLLLLKPESAQQGVSEEEEIEAEPEGKGSCKLALILLNT